METQKHTSPRRSAAYIAAIATGSWAIVIAAALYPLHAVFAAAVFAVVWATIDTFRDV